MNLIDCYVIELIGEPYLEYDVWFLKVKFISQGIEGETLIFNKDKEYFNNVKVGFKFVS